MMPSRYPRLVNALPLLGALVVHGVGHDRMWMACVAMLSVVLLALWRGKMAHRQGFLILWGVVGAVLGAFATLVSELPPGPIPPLPLSILCTSLIFLSGYCVASEQAVYAGTYAWLLAALSLNGPPSPVLYGSVVFLFAVTLAHVFAHARLGETGWRGVLLFVALGSLAPLGALPVMAGMSEMEGTLSVALYQMLRSLQIPRALGLASEMTLSPRSTLEVSTRPLMDLTGSPGRLRTQVMDIFNGQSWFASNEMKTQLPRLPPARGATRPVVITTLEDLAGVLPSPSGTVAVEGASPTVREGWVLLDTVPRGSVVTLTVGKEELPPEVPPPDYMLSIPDDLRGPMREFALPVIAGAVTTRQKAAALENLLREGWEYTLDVDLRGKEHPLLVLLHEKRAAYCVYYASAMALLLRSVDVPTRVLGGFMPEEFNDLTGRTVVRERDAHAWVEAYLPEEHRWVPFDPTPWRARNEAVGLDQKNGLLGNLVSSVRSALLRFWVRLRNNPLEVLTEVLTHPATWLLAAALAAWFWRRRTRGPADAVAQARALQGPLELRRLHARYVKALRRHAVSPPAPSETDEETLERVAREAPSIAQPARAFVDAWQRLRFRRDEAARDAALQQLKLLETS